MNLEVSGDGVTITGTPLRPRWRGKSDSSDGFEIAEPKRLSLLRRISMAATRAVNREHDGIFDDVKIVL